jgi:hypothetical protein
MLCYELPNFSIEAEELQSGRAANTRPAARHGDQSMAIK